MSRFQVVSEANISLGGNSARYCVVDTHYPNSGTSTPVLETVATCPGQSIANSVAAALNTEDTSF